MVWLKTLKRETCSIHTRDGNGSESLLLFWSTIEQYMKSIKNVYVI